MISIRPQQKYWKPLKRSKSDIFFSSPLINSSIRKPLPWSHPSIRPHILALSDSHRVRICQLKIEQGSHFVSSTFVWHDLWYPGTFQANLNSLWWKTKKKKRKKRYWRKLQIHFHSFRFWSYSFPSARDFVVSKNIKQ